MINLGLRLVLSRAAVAITRRRDFILLSGQPVEEKDCQRQTEVSNVVEVAMHEVESFEVVEVHAHDQVGHVPEQVEPLEGPPHHEWHILLHPVRYLRLSGRLCDLVE